MIKSLSLTLLLLLWVAFPSYGWGFFSHKKLNELAVYTLPLELRGIFKANIDYLIEKSVWPDQRRYQDPIEAPKHYIDLDAYPEPRDFLYTIKKDSSGVLPNNIKEHGYLPLVLDSLMDKLYWAFLENDLDRVLYCAADLGHYVGDACVPLHTCSNYDGQKTGQEGIHSLWESSIPEFFFDDWNTYTGPAQYLENPKAAFRDQIWSSHMAVDSVLSLDLKTKEDLDERVYSLQQRGRQVKMAFSKDYCEHYNGLMNSMPERRFRMAILLLGSVWMTAWVNAGQPKLTSGD